MVTSMEGRGLVQRSPDPTDGRRVIVTITDTGRAAPDDREQLIMQRLRVVLSTEFSPADQSRLDAAVPLLERLADRL